MPSIDEISITTMLPHGEAGHGRNRRAETEKKNHPGSTPGSSGRSHRGDPKGLDLRHKTHPPLVNGQIQPEKHRGIFQCAFFSQFARRTFPMCFFNKKARWTFPTCFFYKKAHWKNPMCIFFSKKHVGEIQRAFLLKKHIGKVRCVF